MRTSGTRAARPLLVLAWLAATVLGGVIAWSAVTVVASERGPDGPGVVSQAQVAADLAEATAAGGGSTPSPTPSASGTAPGPTAAPSTTAPGGDPTAGAPATDPGAPGAVPPATAPPATAPPAGGAPDVARTWDVTGGQVGVVCAGATIRLLYATPADGWTVEVESSGPEEVEVDFTRDGAESRVRAECVGGTPELTGGSDSGSGGSGGGGGGDDSGGEDDSGGGGGDGGGDD